VLPASVAKEGLTITGKAGSVHFVSSASEGTL
jgi:hypothetical protein